MVPEEGERSMCLGGGAGLEGVTPREGDLLLNLQQNRDEQGLCFPGDCGPIIPVPWEKLHIPLKPWKALPGCNEQTSCFDAHGGKIRARGGPREQHRRSRAPRGSNLCNIPSAREEEDVL